MKPKITVGICLIILFSGFTSSAQTWQWAKTCGASDALATGREQTKSICTDSNGNVYITSIVGRSNILVGGVPRTGYSTPGLNDAVLAAFTCEGTYKWSKVIGGFYGASDIYVGADGNGNVYAAGKVYPCAPNALPAVHFDGDLILPYSANNVNTYKQSIYLIKYDSEGNLLWLRQPQPADITRSLSISQTFVIDFQVDPAGNSYWLCRLPAGSYADGQVTAATPGIYLLKYDTDGTFTGGVRLDMEAEELDFKMRCNTTNGNIYIGGEHFEDDEVVITMTIGGQQITHSRFLAAFTNTGSSIWVKQNQGTAIWSGYGTSYGIEIDTDNNIYFSGTTGPIATGNPTPDSFNGQAFTDFPNQQPWPFLVKLDQDGNTIWQTNGKRSGLPGISINGDEITVAGKANNMTWQNLTYQQDGNSGGHPYIARFNKTTGAIIAINGLYTSGDDDATVVTADSKGNYYLGGRVSSTITTAAGTSFNNGGGGDFFVAKFGSDDCNFMATTSFQEKSLKIYPNPARDVFNLKGNAAGNYTIYGVLGNAIFDGFVEVDGTINVASLPTGIYLLRIDGENNQYSLKFVKE